MLATLLALKLKSSDCALAKTFLCFCFQNRQGNGRFLLLSVGSRRIVIFLAVHTETLGDEIHVDTVDVLDKSRDWREYLLGDVPVDIELNLSF